MTTQQIFYTKYGHCIKTSVPLEKEYSTDGSCESCCFVLPVSSDSPLYWANGWFEVSAAQELLINFGDPGVDLTSVLGGGTPDPNARYSWNFYLNGVKLNIDEYRIVGSLFTTSSVDTVITEGDLITFNFRKNT